MLGCHGRSEGYVQPEGSERKVTPSAALLEAADPDEMLSIPVSVPPSQYASLANCGELGRGPAGQRAFQAATFISVANGRLYGVRV